MKNGSRCQTAEEPRRGRPDDRKPEQLDVVTTRVESDSFDHRIPPYSDFDDVVECLGEHGVSHRWCSCQMWVQLATGRKPRENLLVDTALFARSRSEVDFATIRDIVSRAERITVITGAGISTDSGIPDFRGKNGLWTRNPAAEKASTLSVYLNDVEVRRASWQARVRNLVETSFEPNANHRALVELENQGRLRAVVTQNVDGLHEAAGHGEGVVIPVHGTWAFSRCWSCGDRRPMRATLERVIAGDLDPHCLECGGVLKSDTILFEEPLIPEVIEAAMTAAEECDLMLAIGTKLSVTPAANVVPRARSYGALVVIVNDEPTDRDRFAHGILRGSIGDFLPHLTSPI